MTHNPRLDAHLFICTNTKASGASCGAKESSILRDYLKDWVAKVRPEWRGRVRVNASGCLGHCSRGIAAVLYPGGQWFTELKQGDHALLEKALDDSMQQIATVKDGDSSSGNVP
jgi:(2Fe-2S) ferredoxin